LTFIDLISHTGLGWDTSGSLAVPFTGGLAVERSQLNADPSQDTEPANDPTIPQLCLLEFEVLHSILILILILDPLTGRYPVFNIIILRGTLLATSKFMRELPGTYQGSWLG